MQQSTSQIIIDFLSRDESAATIVIAPGAPPVLRKGQGVSAVMAMVMTPKEIYEIMMEFRNYAQISENMIALASGSFAFPVPKVGRFRIDYLTQRGSYVLTISRISSNIPLFDDLFDNPVPALAVLDLIKTSQVSVVTVCSADAATKAVFVCAMLQKINVVAGMNRLICTVERNLKYLVRHGHGIVVQCEVDTDVPTLETGVQNVVGLRPDILYVSEIWLDSELAQVRAAVMRGILTIVDSTNMEHAYMGKRLLSPGYDGAVPALVQRWLPITLTTMTSGKLALQVGTPAVS